MSLSPGTRIGSYEIVAPIGAGGMGEVYRARDTRLQRDVAIKVLPELFARDPERLARFEREARTLAAVSHPNIAQVFGVEGGALVMEFADGEDLAQRIAREGAVPLDEAMPIAIQMAEAIAAAHDQGIVHRDLKPANIKVGEDGTVKVLDFGLAKALSAPDLRVPSPSSIDNSPTITSPFQMSQLGVVFGTAAYMAPEQAKGRPVDKRVDIWAFGCVLFEMLAGRKPFDGDDVTEVLAAIVRDQPDWSRLPPATPPAVRTLLRRCLEKDRRERLPDVGAARLELKDARDAAPVPVVAPPREAARVSRVGRTLAFATVFAIAVLAAAALGFQFARSRETQRDNRMVKSAIVPPAPLTGAPALRMQISPDGRKLAFVAPVDAGTPMLWVRSLDSMTTQPLAGTANASAPFWSPDSRWIAFFAEGKLRKIEAAGGAVLILCDAATAPPGTWSAEDVIVFSGPGGLARVPASGGRPASITSQSAGERVHLLPVFLPDGRHVLFSYGAASAPRGIGIVALETKQVTPLLEDAAYAAYANGRLLFLRGSTLLAQPFDPERFVLSGRAEPLAEDIQINPSTGTGAFSVSQNGVLVYQVGRSMGTQLVWMDRAGKSVGTVGEAGLYRDVQLSPDERFASVTIASATSTASDVWIIDLERNLPRRLSFGPGSGYAAVWTRDGRSVIYSARRGAAADLVMKSASGTGPEETLLQNGQENVPIGLSPDGQTLLFAIPTGAASGKLHRLSLSDRRAAPVLETPYSQVPASISPDGKWLAYVSDETARREVYVTSFPAGVGKWQISRAGGEAPQWNANGKELFLLTQDRLLAVDVSTTATDFDAGALRPLFDVRVPAPPLGTRSSYAVTRDGQRFLFNTWDLRAAATPITLVVNWPEALKK